MKIIKIGIVSFILGAFLSSLVHLTVKSQYAPEPIRFNQCLKEYGLEKAATDYQIVKSGYPFYGYKLEPTIDGGSDCVGVVVATSQSEMYGPYGYDLNFIFYFVLSLVLISTAVYVRRKRAHIRN